MTKKTSLDERLKAAVSKQAAADMNPRLTWTPPPPPKEDVVVPDVRDFISDNKTRLKLLRLVEESNAWGIQEKAARKAREPITQQIKEIMGEYEIGKAMCGSLMLTYFTSPRRSLSREKLLEHGISPQILDACTITKDTYTLRIVEPGESDNGDV